MRVESYLPELAPKLRTIAGKAAPLEACGYVTRAQQLVEVPNTAKNPSEEFNAGPLHELESREGELLAIWHTHPEDQAPSEQDVVSCMATFLPWVVAGPSKVWVLYPEARQYVGRDFVYGVDDCWMLVSDWYRQEAGIHLPWFERPADLWWKTPGPSPYVESVEAYGFRAIPFTECGLEGLRRGDVILSRVDAERINHAAVYLGGGNILQHLYGELSRVEQLTDRWQRRARLVCRHNSLVC
jgi:cell wall-associated NlpC family hydrolase